MADQHDRGARGLSGTTIAALATAPGVGAVAIVRLSGPRAFAIARELTGLEPEPRRAELCTLRDADATVIDRGLLLAFPGPHSYTGEDVVELHVHGGPIVSDWLLQRVYALGAEPARPGEFTLRAFLNDKLDLVQAEAVADLIGSGSRLAAQAALRSLQGEFSAAVRNIQAGLTEVRVHAEAWLDFPDEDIDPASAASLAGRLDAVEADLEALLERAEQGSVLRDGLAVVIAGAPNAGKSSLLNRLAGFEAAIVTEIPGTTRDPLREQLLIGGVPVSVVDTAGLRASDDPVEREGLRRARAEMAKADHVLWVADARDGLEAARRAARAQIEGDTPFTVVLNKVDLTGEPAGITEDDGMTVVRLSALRGDGVAALAEHLQRVASRGGAAAGAFSARRRHLDALRRAGERLRAARAHLPGALELAAEELRGAQAALSELTGEVTSDDLLGEIFATFCIGK
ncbi:MAG TPA: tRNA uridine-5-carboxymethylaminomethyl(34) synthesis GTPase MnmE [Gammaproteobacteria bacterium]